MSASLATNPNAPLDLLLRLAEHHPVQVIQNAAFELAMLVEPDLMARAPWTSRRSLARCREAPDWLYAALILHADTSTLAELAANPSLPDELMERLGTHGDEQVQFGLMLNPKASVELRKRLVSGSSRAVRIAAQTSRIELTAWVQLLLRAEKTGYGKPRPRSRQHVKHLDAREQKELLGGGSWARELLVRQPRLDPAIKRRLAADPSERVRLLLVKRHDLDDEAAVALATTRDPAACALLAERRRMPLPLVEALVRTDHPGVHRRLAHHPSLPPEALPLLVAHRHIASEMLARSDLTGEFLVSLAEHDPVTVAAHPLTPDSMLERLATNPSWQVRHALAANRCAPAVVLRALADDPDERVRAAARAAMTGR